jgi:3-methyl-2-oxobutanoate hydroxymethyltransferase
MGTVLLGHDNTRRVPLSLMVMLAEAVRRGAPSIYLVGDMPFESMAAGDEAVLDAARRFRDEAGCDGVKVEVEQGHAELVAKLAAAGFETIAHLGLRPQSVLTPDGYRAQARDEAAIAQLAEDAARMANAGAAMILLEAVPDEAAAAVVGAVDVPVIGCGAGPSCDGHVVVTQDMLGATTMRPPRFVPVYSNLREQTESAMRRWVDEIDRGVYPGREHVYGMRKSSAPMPSGK